MGTLAARAPAPALLALLGELLELALEVRDAVLGAAAADLQLRLARAAPADAAGEARERVVLLREARHRVLELRQLDLQLAVPALGALGEDVEDELRAVDDLEVGLLGDAAGLRGRELAVEDQHAGVELHGADDDLLELALAHDELRDRCARAAG